MLLLAGPTASGKTELAVQLALRYGAEIVGADSRQIYRGMPIGTALPSAWQLAAVRHHCVDFLDPHERYSAARFTLDAMAAIDDIHARGKRAIVAGGTGFYLRALAGGVELAATYDEALRARLAAEAAVHPAAFLHAWLARRDPERAARLHPGDRYRVLRALEVALGAPAARDRPLRTLASGGVARLTVMLDVPLAELDARIERRTDRMLTEGLVEEAERIGREAVAASAVGYPQALAYLRGWGTRTELRTALLRATRRYARRQRAWFRAERDAVWLATEGVDATVREKLGWSANVG